MLANVTKAKAAVWLNSATLIQELVNTVNAYQNYVNETNPDKLHSPSDQSVQPEPIPLAGQGGHSSSGGGGISHVGRPGGAD